MKSNAEMRILSASIIFAQLIDNFGIFYSHFQQLGRKKKGFICILHSRRRELQLYTQIPIPEALNGTPILQPLESLISVTIVTLSKSNLCHTHFYRPSHCLKILKIISLVSRRNRNFEGTLKHDFLMNRIQTKLKRSTVKSGMKNLL